MADVALPSVATATPAAADTVVGVQGGAVKRFAISALPFTQTGAGAVARTAQDKMREVVSVKDFGATGDGIANDYAAIAKTIAAAKAAKKSVYFPAGTYIVDNNFVFDSSHSRMTIFGDGPSSCVKLANTLAAGTDPGWLFLFADALSPILDFRLCGLRLDGSRSTSTYGSTSHGVVVSTDALVENLQIDNVTAHGFLYQGFHLFSGGARLSNVYAYDNGFHGIGVSAGTTFYGEVEIHGAVCNGNGQYGIDVSKGRAIVTDVVCRGNAAGGMKFSEGCEFLHLQNALFEGNAGPGFQNTGVASDMELYADNVITRGNAGYGFRVGTGKRVVIGRLVSIDNDGAWLGDTDGGDVLFAAGFEHLSIDSIYVEGGTAHGVSISGSTLKTISVGHIEAVRNQKAGFRIAQGANVVHAVINSGVFRDNNQAGLTGASAAALQVGEVDTIKVRGCVFTDTQAAPTQVSAMYFSGGTEAEVDQCHFGAGISAGGQVYSANTGTRVRFGSGNTGIVTRARGVYTGNGGGTSVTATFASALTGLGGVTRFAQVSPASADAKGAHYISSLSSAEIVVTWSASTPSGTGNVSFRYDVEMEIQR